MRLGRALRRLLLPALLCLLVVGGRAEGGRPRPGGFVCGTGTARELDALVRSAYHESLALRHPAARGGRVQAETGPSDVGDVALLEDDGSIVRSASTFDLAGKGVRFERAGASRYRAVAAGATFDRSGIPLALGDDASRQVELEFLFPFYGTDYTSVRVNSDGNLTFGAPDTASTERDLARFTTGPPRIGGLFADLDPSRGSVRYRREADGIVFLWDDVPNFDAANSNSFAIKLSKETGAIVLAYATRVDATDAVVGISPGTVSAEISAVDFSADPPTGDLAGSIVEVFSDQAELSESALAKKFFQTHPDGFDHLIVFLAFDYRLFGGAFAYELNVRNDVAGIGLLQLDNAPRFGSHGRLRSFVLMGPVDGPGRYPDDPRQVFLGTNSTLSILGQEAGHRWLAFTPFRDGDTNSRTILGRQSAHWSFYFDSDASVMEGNDIEDRGTARGNQRFLTVGATSTYSALDRYVMGIAGKETVPPMFMVENPSGGRPAETNPVLGATFGGRRKDFTIEDVVAANGARLPSVLQSPKVIRQAFILLSRPGRKPTDAQVAKVQRIRDAWIDFFNSSTGGQGWIVTDLQNGAGTTAAALVFPHLRSEPERYTGIALVNWGAQPADVLLSYRDASGARPYAPAAGINPRMLTLAPGRRLALTAEEIHALGPGAPAGWIRAESTSERVAGYFVDGDRAAGGLDGAAAPTSLAGTLYFSRTGAGGGVLPAAASTSRLELVNPGVSAAAVTLDWIDEAGRTLASADRIIPSWGRLDEEVSSLFAGGLPVGAGYVAARSPAGLAGYHLFEAAGVAGSLLAQPAAAPSGSRLYAAQFISGGAAGGPRYFTDLSLINTAAEARTVEIRLVAGAGTLVDAGANPATLRIAAGGCARVRGEKLFALPDPAVSSVIEGSLVVSADGPGLIGDVVFGDAARGRFMAALPLAPGGALRQLVPHVAQGRKEQGESLFTGLALYNPGGADTTVTLELYSDRGERTGSTRFLLAPGARLARTLPEFLPGLPDPIGGYVMLTSSEPVVSAALTGAQSMEFLAAVTTQAVK